MVTASLDNSAARYGMRIAAVKSPLLKGHTSGVLSAAFSPDGRRVVTASYDSARLWDAESGKEIALLKGHIGCGAERRLQSGRPAARDGVFRQ